MRKFIIANWKCNPVTLASAKKLFISVQKGLKNAENSQVIICPPFVYLEELLKLRKKLKLGAQDCYWQEKGAFTGEISAVMLKNLECKYVILGHSERKAQETDKLVNQKIKSALKSGLEVILCIETISQLKHRLKGISKNNIEKILIAYEPPGAISTSGGKIPSNSHIIEKLKEIKKITNTFILYGGSVDSSNIERFMKLGFNGALVGAASLKAKEFIGIVQAVEDI